MRLEAAGGVILGKTNCDEFAMGSSNENSAFGPVRNPVALDRVPGGSSGGSAAAVAQGTAVVALGSDTGGSVRQPASFCGVVGVTPTYGRVSRYGLVAFASSLDHIGPFARTVRDAALVARKHSRPRPLRCNLRLRPGAPLSPRNSTARWPAPGSACPANISKDSPANQAIASINAVELLKKLGCEVRDISLPATKYAVPCYYIIATAEASSNLARYDGVRYTTRAS